MKRAWQRAVLASLTGAACLVVFKAAAAPTDGFVQYSSSYTVQNRTGGCGGFTDMGGGQFKTWVCAGEERVEMRWNNWPNQNIDNQFECDAMFDAATQNTAIHQIKSNTGGEPIYIQVQSPGTMRNDNGSVFMTGMANTWFHLNSIFNPVTGNATAYINGSLKVTRSYPTSDRAWYFKNGTYNNGLPAGGKSTAQFKNIKHWIKSSTTTVSFEAENVSVVDSGTGHSLQTDGNSSNGQWISLDAENTGSWIEFTTPSVPAGTYSVRMMWKGNNNRGQLNLKIDGTQVGGTLDQYSSGQTYPTTTFANRTFSSTGTHTIRLTVTGKNASSSNYVLSADKFTFVGQ